MDIEENEFKIPENIRCDVCGESDFTRRDGYFFCNECGVKHDEIREIEVENEYRPEGGARVKTHKVLKEEVKKPELTSWECYNYILRGLVEELINLGAREDLKLVTLQLWSAYLRRMEVAFFSKKRADLPRLSVRYHDRDAQAIYNQTKIKRKRRRRSSKKGSDQSGTTERSSRAWNKSKRKLDESLYSTFTTSCDSFSKTSANSSSSAPTSRAIRINFNRTARRILKKKMPKKHIAKHEEDTDGELTCHSTKLKARELKMRDKKIMSLHMKHLYAILAIALNLIGDDIQLVDLVRFIHEGHIGKGTVSQYFPENVVQHSKEILREIDFYVFLEPGSYELLRSYVKSMSEFVHVTEFRRPDFISLTKRYAAELNLPQEIALYIERLINILPPCMKVRNSEYPAYEARAMAYIIYVLKLLFGLDGYKEKAISENAIKVNAEIQKHSQRGSKHPMLFVWDEWVEYIEMRKVIISQYNSAFSEQYKMKQTLAQHLEDMKEKKRRETELQTEKESVLAPKAKVASLHKILENFLLNCDSKNFTKYDSAFTVPVQPNFMPAHSYFKRILLHTSAFEDTPFDIPEFMRKDHTVCSVRPFLVAKDLRKFFSATGVELKVNRLPCTENREYIGIFYPPRKSGATQFQANFKISEEKWREKIEIKRPTDEIDFKLNYEKLPSCSRPSRKSDCSKKNLLEDNRLPEWININTSQLVGHSDNTTDKEHTRDRTDVASMHSIDVFNEHDMEPIVDIVLNEPRRRIDGVDLFEGISDCDDDDEENHQEIGASSNNNNSIKQENSDTITLNSSALDYWIIMGLQTNYNNTKLKSLAQKLPRTFLWLLETCAQMLNMHWNIIYKELLVLEITFGMGIQNLNDPDFKGSISLKNVELITDLDKILKTHCDLW